mgnify:CR=1 FL=1
MRDETPGKCKTHSRPITPDSPTSGVRVFGPPPSSAKLSSRSLSATAKAGGGGPFSFQNDDAIQESRFQGEKDICKEIEKKHDPKRTNTLGAFKEKTTWRSLPSSKCDVRMDRRFLVSKSYADCRSRWGDSQKENPRGRQQRPRFLTKRNCYTSI